MFRAIYLILLHSHLLSCNSPLPENNIVNNKQSLCEYVNKPVGIFVESIKSSIIDTVARKQYAGHLKSVFLYVDDGYYELFPNIQYSDSLFLKIRDSFNLNLIEKFNIKCIIKWKDKKVDNSCGCIEGTNF